MKKSPKKTAIIILLILLFLLNYTAIYRARYEFFTMADNNSPHIEIVKTSYISLVLGNDEKITNSDIDLITTKKLNLGIYSRIVKEVDYEDISMTITSKCWGFGKKRIKEQNFDKLIFQKLNLAAAEL